MSEKQEWESSFLWLNVMAIALLAGVVCWRIFGYAYDSLPFFFLGAFLWEALRSGIKTEKYLKKRRRGELAWTMLTEIEAMKKIIVCIYPNELSMMRDFCCDVNVRSHFLTYAAGENLRYPEKLEEIQEALGGVPLNVPYPYNVGEIFRQAVRYPVER